MAVHFIHRLLVSHPDEGPIDGEGARQRQTAPIEHLDDQIVAMWSLPDNGVRCHGQVLAHGHATEWSRDLVRTPDTQPRDRMCSHAIQAVPVS